MYKKILQYVAGVSTFTTVLAVSSMTMAAYYPTQSQATAYAPVSCQDNGTVFSNKRYYKGATFYPYDTMYGSTNVGWALDRAASKVMIYNPFSSFTIQGPSGGFVAKSNSKPAGIQRVLAASNDSGTVVNGPNPTSATTLGMQLIYNIVRKPLVAGNGAAWAGGQYIEALSNGTFGSMTNWTWTNWAYGTVQQGYECANYYVSRCGDGITDNGGAVSGAALVDAYGYPIWTNGNTPNGGEQCDLGAQNGQPGSACTASCQNAPIPQNPDLTMIKSVVGNTTGYQSGDTITYQLTYSNIGTGLATTVSIVDQLPAGVTYVANSTTSAPNIGQPTVAGNILTWNLSSLAPGANGTITFQVKITNFVACVPYTNMTTIAAINEPTTLTGNNAASAAITTVCPSPDVLTTKTVSAISGSYMPGNAVEYTLGYQNIGQGAASGVVVVDTLPAGVTFVGVTSSTPTLAAPTVGISGGLQTLTWNIGDLVAGASGQIKIKVTINANTPTCTNLQLNNNLTISATNEPGTLLGNNPSNATFVMQCIDLRSNKTVNTATVQSGSIVTYTITYGNSGNLTVATGFITDTLPTGMVYVPGSAVSTPNLGTPAVGGTVGGPQQIQWNVANLTPGFVGTITFQAQVTAATQNQTYVNNVCIVGDGVNPATGTGYFNNNNCGQAISTATQKFDLSIKKTPTMRNVVMNEEFDYTLTVSNTGQSAVNGFTVKDYLPAGLDYVSSTPSGVYNAATKTVTWSSLNIPAIGTLALVVRVKYVGPVSLGMQTNWTEICDYNGVGTGNGQNPNNPSDVDSNPCNGTGNNEDDISSGSVVPGTGSNPFIDLSINKTPSNQLAYTGQQVTFTLAVHNNGTTGATNFSVNDYLPAGLQFVSASPAATYSAATNTITWNGLSLAAGASTGLTVNAIYTATGTVTNWTEICNYNGLGSGNNPYDIDSNPCNGTGNNEDDVSSGSVQSAFIDLNINKLANGVKNVSAVSGQVINFSLIVGNSGNAAATGFSVKDYLPVGFIFVQASNGGTFSGATASATGGGTITWTGLSLSPGATTTVTFSAIYTDNVTRTNYAEVCAYHGLTINQSQQAIGPADIDSNPCNNGANPPVQDDESSATVNPSTGLYDLSLSKLINGSTAVTAASGATVTVTLNVTNSGAGGVSNFSVYDYMPVGLDYVSGSSNIPGTTYNSGTRVITFSGLNIGSTGTVAITFQAVYGGGVTRVNYAEICGYNGIGSGNGQTVGSPYDIDSNPCNNGANVPVQDDESSAQISPSGGGNGGTTMDIQIIKLVNGAATYAATYGETVTFTLRVSNEGNTAPGAPVSVVDYLPTNVEYIAGSATPNTSPVTVTYDAATRKLTWSGIVLSNNDFKLLTFQAKYNDNVARTNYTEVCGYNGVGTASGNNQSGLPTNTLTNPQDIDSNPCNNGANPPVQDDESQATITPRSGGGGGGGPTNRCGDGLVARPNTYGQYEECDLGTGNAPSNLSDSAAMAAGYACSNSCKTLKTVGGYCGDNIVQAGEMCDKGANGGLITVGTYAGKQCTSTCTVKGVLLQSPQCAYIDPPSIQQGEYLPYRWDIESNISMTNSVATCSTVGQVLKDSVQCEFTVTNAKGDTVGSWTNSCTQKDTTPLRTSAHNQALSSMGYTPENQPAMDGWSSRKSPSNLSWLGEHKISMKVVNFKTCNKNGTGSWEAVANVSTNQRVCEMNFAVTKPYMVSRGPLGNFATDGLSTFLQLPDGDKIFANPLSPITQKFDVTQTAKDSVNTLLNAYDKLAVSAGTLPGTTTEIKKVPGKDIYVVDANGGYITIGDNTQNAANTKPFTLIVKNGNLTIKGDLTNTARGMYIVPNGNIQFAMNSCNTKQSVQGIFISLENITSLNPAGTSTSIHNINMNSSWCSAGDLTIKGVLIGNNVSSMTNARRSNVNNWFNDLSPATQLAERQENLLDRGAVVLKYNTDIFDNLPPGAEVLSQVLNAYKK